MELLGAEPDREVHSEGVRFPVLRRCQQEVWVPVVDRTGGGLRYNRGFGEGWGGGDRILSGTQIKGLSVWIGLFYLR